VDENGQTQGITFFNEQHGLTLDVAPFWADASFYNTHKSSNMVVPKIGDFLAFEGDPLLRNPTLTAAVPPAWASNRNYPFFIASIQDLSGDTMNRYRFTLGRLAEVDLDDLTP
jgi:hypothetical protein